MRVSDKELKPYCMPLLVAPNKALTSISLTIPRFPAWMKMGSDSTQPTQKQSKTCRMLLDTESSGGYRRGASSSTGSDTLLWPILYFYIMAKLLLCFQRSRTLWLSEAIACIQSLLLCAAVKHVLSNVCNQYLLVRASGYSWIATTIVGFCWSDSDPASHGDNAVTYPAKLKWVS